MEAAAVTVWTRTQSTTDCFQGQPGRGMGSRKSLLYSKATSFEGWPGSETSHKKMSGKVWFWALLRRVLNNAQSPQKWVTQEAVNELITTQSKLLPFSVHMYTQRASHWARWWTNISTASKWQNSQHTWWCLHKWLIFSDVLLGLELCWSVVHGLCYYPW